MLLAVCLLRACRKTFLLPPAYVVRGKVIFILGNVCLFTIAGGGTPSQVWWWGGTPSHVWTEGGYPISGLDWRVPHPRSGQGGTPSQVWPGGTPYQVWLGGYPIPGLDRGYPIPGLAPPARSGGGPHPRSDWGVYPPRPTMIGWGTLPSRPSMGYPPSQTWDGVPPITGWGTPPSSLDGVPQPSMDGVPPPPPQHSEHLLRGGRYASCVHAGGLSCLWCVYNNRQRLMALGSMIMCRTVHTAPTPMPLDSVPYSRSSFGQHTTITVNHYMITPTTRTHTYQCF